MKTSLLCIAEDNSGLVVWNPYLCQTKWIRLRNTFHRYDVFALGHDNNRNHKILRFLYDAKKYRTGRGRDNDVYDFSSDSWRRVFDVNPHRGELFYYSGVSLKGNSYFFGQEVTIEEEEEEVISQPRDYLLCFDFTTERFGPRLSLPFNPPSPNFDYLTLSWARDEKLAVLYNHYNTREIIEIWISTKIEPNTVSWSTFLTVDTSLINGLPDRFSTFYGPRSFFIDEEKKVAVFFDNKGTETGCYQVAYIIGDNGYFKSVKIGVISNSQWQQGILVCSSYVPSLVQLQD